MARLRWSGDARADLRDVRRFIARDSRANASAMSDRIIAATQRLAQYPESGRMVPELRDRSYREIIVGPYRVVYRYLAGPDSVLVVAIVHGSRLLRLPSDFA